MALSSLLSADVRSPDDVIAFGKARLQILRLGSGAYIQSGTLNGEPLGGRSKKKPLATKNLLEDTDGLRRPPLLGH